MNRFQALRERRHAQWLTQMKQQLRDVLNNQAEPAPRVYLFGFRARGDWDGLSDTDLLPVVESIGEAEDWANQLLDGGVAQDVIALDQETWHNLFLAQSCYNASQAAKQGQQRALLEREEEPRHTHVLNDLVSRLQQNCLETRALDVLPLRSLSRMAIQSLHPMDATPPSELFDLAEGDQALDQDTDS